MVTSDDELAACRERATVQVWADEPDRDAPKPTVKAAAASAPIVLVPGAILQAKLKLEHVHFLYGDYDPLLGVRGFEIRVAAATPCDDLPPDREQ